MERVPAKTLGADRGQRLLQHRCECIPFSLIGRRLLFEAVDSSRGPCEDFRRKEWTADVPIVRRVTQDMHGYTTESATASRKHLHELIAVIAANHVSESSKWGSFCRLHQIRQTK